MGVPSEQPKRQRGRPKTGRIPKESRSIRIGPVWKQAMAIAEQRGETVTEVIERALNDYVRNNTTK